MLAEPLQQLFRLGASRAERLQRSACLFGIRIALRQRFLRKLRGQVAGELFELRRQPSRQIALQCFGRGVLRQVIETGGFVADFLQRRGHFARKHLAVGRHFVVPLLGGNAMFGGNGLRGSFPCGGMNLLPRIRQQTCDLASELHGGVGRAGNGREGTQPFRAILRGSAGVGQRQVKIRLRCLRRRFVMLFASFRGMLRMLLQIRNAGRANVRLRGVRKGEPVVGRKGNAPGVSGKL